MLYSEKEVVLIKYQIPAPEQLHARLPDRGTPHLLPHWAIQRGSGNFGRGMREAALRRLKIMSHSAQSTVQYIG